MVNNFWAFRREMMSQNNEGNNQTPNNPQSANGHSNTPQPMSQAMSMRPQNHLMGVNNLTQERRQNNIADAATLPMPSLSMPSFSVSTNNTTTVPSYRASLARYGQTLSLDPPKPHVSSTNTPIVPSYCASLARYGQTLPLDLPKAHMSSANSTPTIPSYRASLPRYGQTLPVDLPQSHMMSSNTHIIPSYRSSLARYGQVLPVSLPQSHTSSSNSPIIPSHRANLAQNSSSSCLGSQGSTSGFRNPSKPNLHNQKNFRYHPYEEGSNHKNNSSVFNDFDPYSRVDMNNFCNLESCVAPIATPPTCPSGNANLNSYRANLARNSSSGYLGSQGFAENFQNPSKPNLHNQKNFRYHPYGGEGFNHMNNSLAFNDFNPLSSVDMSSFQNLRNYVPPIATPPLIRPSGEANLELTRERTMEQQTLKNNVVPIATPPPIIASGNVNLDLTLATTTEHCMFDIQNTDAWKRPTDSPDDCHEEIQTPTKELLLLKDDKNTFPSSLVIESDGNENDDKGLDLDLSL